MLMNREQRRELKRRMKARGHPTVTLRGGPMDDWVVEPNAPALLPEWREHFLEEVARGMYAEDHKDEMPAVPAHFRGWVISVLWDSADESDRALYRIRARAEHGAGHYELRRDALEAEWISED